MCHPHRVPTPPREVRPPAPSRTRPPMSTPVQPPKRQEMFDNDFADWAQVGDPL